MAPSFLSPDVLALLVGVLLSRGARGSQPGGREEPKPQITHCLENELQLMGTGLELGQEGRCFAGLGLNRMCLAPSNVTVGCFFLRPLRCFSLELIIHCAHEAKKELSTAVIFQVNISPFRLVRCLEC